MNFFTFNILGFLDFIAAYFIINIALITIIKFRSFKLSVTLIAGIISAAGYYITHGMMTSAGNSIQASHLAQAAIYLKVLTPVLFYTYMIKFLKPKFYDYIFLSILTALTFALVVLNSFPQQLFTTMVLTPRLGYQPTHTAIFTTLYVLIMPGGLIYFTIKTFFTYNLAKKWVWYSGIVCSLFILDSLIVHFFEATFTGWLQAIFIAGLTIAYVVEKRPEMLETISGTEMLESIQIPIMITGTDGKLIFINKEFREITGISATGYKEKHLSKIKNIPTSLEKQLPDTKIRIKISEKNGKMHPVISDKIKLNSDNYIYSFYKGDNDENLINDINRLSQSTHLYKKEINDLKEREKLLKESNDVYSIAAQSNNAGIWDWDLSKCCVTYSKTFKSLLGYRSFELSESPKEWLNRMEQTHIKQFVDHITMLTSGTKPRFSFEHKLTKKDGTEIWALAEGIAIKDRNGIIFRIIGSIKDISIKKQTEQELAYELRHDSSTGLPNSTYLQEELAKLHAAKDDETHYGVLLLDIDRFKGINESLGYHKGDQILREIGKRFSKILRKEDILFRMGGDEFIILMKNISCIKDATIFAGKLQEQLRKKFIIDDNKVYLTSSMGIAISRKGEDEPGRILSEAQIALSQAKEQGKANYKIFDNDLNNIAMKILSMEKDIKEAIKNEDFKLAYQPIVNLKTHTIIGMETLIRWKHKTKGFISPEDFIPLAEDTDLIIPIGDWVLKKACMKAAELFRNTHVDKDFHLAINISGKQLKDPNFVSKVRDAIAEAGIPSKSVILEITERSIIHDFDKVRETLIKLAETGIRFHLDDFGEGYTSLKLLRDLPISTMKIDKSYVSGIKRQSNQSKILKSIIELGHNMGKTIIAEGIEKKNEAETLLDFKCEMGQGYFFFKPIHEHEIEEFINKNISQPVSN